MLSRPLGRRWCHASTRQVVASLAALRALPLNHAVKFKWQAKLDAFVFLNDDAPVAYVNRCSHVALEMDLNDADFLMHGVIQCKVHGALFDASTGVCLRPPPRCKHLRPLLKIPVTVEGDNVVTTAESTTPTAPNETYRTEKLKQLQANLDAEAAEAQRDLDLVNQRAAERLRLARAERAATPSRPRER
ncbi:hypothetical protein ACHHYP_08634 [Achlya hypogyna]|uniref:Rieske domain-containing protein n=1 Tax=Achlya hypogyna TaxID=1202772 RepID=A0A1V9ZK92_ACHHY|nr:hypothetical protein ACHHYP_08634 [Achlya hypogyna]